MRTLSEIIDAAATGAPATDEELRDAVNALCRVASLTRMAGGTAAKMARHGWTDRQVAEDLMGITWRAYRAVPAVWMGDNNPLTPAGQERRAIAAAVFARAEAGAAAKADWIEGVAGEEEGR